MNEQQKVYLRKAREQLLYLLVTIPIYHDEYAKINEAVELLENMLITK